ncbi:ABC transporter permease [Actinoalloteichus hymeniacidonis]|uniref:Exporter of polyketide antibiotics n=1 Tax=Actinoalloteichus hymeniacidonis TaxID=340345 RepID=A0AAC9MX27_9PSEU|nr:ABC transporter permease subunit [Actinoalloteichus hymeniacidonis]AOS61890.1 putative exporter of polyketide antibiotics [Actinoalloteichus hymeniacidonis]MBB5910090.1 ABC-2 type transport system permease protein [Actinoalloteichus hymeniacidonis]
MILEESTARRPSAQTNRLTPLRAIAALYFRQSRRSAVAVLAVVAGLSGLVAAQFETMFAGALDARALVELTGNPAIRIIFGTPLALDDPGGFTVWRTGIPVTVLVGVWACLIAIRLTRGEEEAGRSDLLLAGRTTRAEAVALSLLVLVCCLLAIGVVLAGTLVLTGTAVVGSVLHAAGLFGVGMGFAALGTLCAQILPSRAGATGLSIGLLVAAMLARMVADGIENVDWLRWLTPFGVVGEVGPYWHDRSAPLIVLFLLPVLFAGAALAIARERDIGTGVLSPTARRPSRMMFLGSLGAFAIRRALPALAGWAIGLAAFAGLLGMLAISIVDFLAGSARFTELAAAAGFGLLNATSGYAATMFVLLSIPVSCFAATRIAAMREDEHSGRSIPLFATAVSRQWLVAVEFVISLFGAIFLFCVIGAAMWWGTRVIQAPLSLGQALTGAFNLLPIALLCLGAATAALGWLPRHVLAIGCLPVTAGFLLDVLAESTGAPAWVRDLSPFAHLAAVPHSPPDGAGFAALSVIALLLAILGGVGHARRDLGG